MARVSYATESLFNIKGLTTLCLSFTSFNSLDQPILVSSSRIYCAAKVYIFHKMCSISLNAITDQTVF